MVYLNKNGKKTKASLSGLFLFEEKIYAFSGKIYDFILRNLRTIVFIVLTLSILFGIFKTIFYHGFNVDGYQYYALSIEKFIRTREIDYLFANYYARNRIVYPFIIAIIHIIIPVNVSVLACCINLAFAILSIFMIRKIMIFLNFNKKVIDLSTLLIVTSYNFLNFWFNILSDIVGLGFFLLFLYFLLKFKENKNYFNLLFSILFYIYSVLTREHFILAILLFLYLFDKWKIRILLLSVFFIFIIIILFTIHTKIPFIDNLLGPAIRQYYYDKEYVKLYLLLQKKWIYEGYFIGFMKGLIKIGILPSLFIILITSLDYIRSKRKNKERNSKIKEETIIGWFIIFPSIYYLIYSNVYSSTALRYLIPIAWIPFIYVSNNIIRNKTSILLKNIISFETISFNSITLRKKMLKALNFGLIAFLTLCPIAWSSLEMYEARNYITGTGPLYKPNIYINDMNERRSISQVDWDNLWLDSLNDTYYVTTLKQEINGSNYNIGKGKIILTCWLHVNKSIKISIRLKSHEDAHWGFSLYKIREDFYSELGNIAFTNVNLRAFDSFQIYDIYINSINEAFILRNIGLITVGPINGKIIWDYVKIEVT